MLFPYGVQYTLRKPTHGIKSFSITGWLLLWYFSHLSDHPFLASCCLYLSLCSEYRTKSVCPSLVSQGRASNSPVLCFQLPPTCSRFPYLHQVLLARSDYYNYPVLSTPPGFSCSTGSKQIWIFPSFVFSTFQWQWMALLSSGSQSREPGAVFTTSLFFRPPNLPYLS